MAILKFLKNLWKLIKNPNIFDDLTYRYSRLSKDYNSLDIDFSRLSTTNSILRSKIEGYIENIENGLLLEIPNKTKGDVIYYVTNGLSPSEKILKYAIATVYGDKIRHIIEITVSHYVIMNGLLYIVMEEDPDTLIYAKNPNLFDTFDLALKYVKSLSVDGISAEVVTEFSNKHNVIIKPNTFTLPCEIGRAIYHVLTIEDKPRLYTEYTVLGFDIREDGIKLVVYSEDDAALERIDIDIDGLKDDAWSFTKPE